VEAISDKFKHKKEHREVSGLLQRIERRSDKTSFDAPLMEEGTASSTSGMKGWRDAARKPE